MTDGVLLCDKPAGVTSHDVVAAAAALGSGVKVGHAGTLDPFATGLLLVLVGRATRVQRFLMAWRNATRPWRGSGWTSTTGDPEGEIAPGRMPRGAPTLPTGRSASARRRTRRSRSAASAPTRWRGAGEASSWTSAR